MYTSVNFYPGLANSSALIIQQVNHRLYFPPFPRPHPSIITFFNFPSFIQDYKIARIKGAQSRLKSLAKLFKFVVCNPCQSSPSLTILVPLWFIIISLMFFYLYKVLFLGFLQFNGHFFSMFKITQDTVTEPL